MGVSARVANCITNKLGRGERTVLLSLIGLLIIVVVVFAIAPTLLRDEQPIPKMTAESGTEIVEGLSSQGWDCFESDGDAHLQRCFENESDDSIASVSVLSDDDAVAMVKAEATGSDSDAFVNSLSVASEAMDEALLPDSEARIAGLTSGKAFEAQELPGGVLVETTPVSVKVLNGKDLGASAVTAYLPKALPLPDQLTLGLEKKDFECHVEFSLLCESQIDGVDVSISQRVRPVDPNMVEVRLDHIDEATSGSQSKAAEVRERLGQILSAADVGLTDADGAEFLVQKAKTGHRGDFAGYEMAVVTGVDDASGSMKIEFTSVMPTATSAIDW